MAANAVVEQSKEMVAAAATGTQADTIYLMGISFVLGALFAIFLLVLLDFMKRDRVSREPD